MKRNFKNIRVDYQAITEMMSEVAAMWSLGQDELLYTYKFGNDKKEEFGSYILEKPTTLTTPLRFGVTTMNYLVNTKRVPYCNALFFCCL